MLGHLKIAPDSIGYVGNQYNSLLMLRPTPTSPPSLDPTSCLSSCHSIFKQLVTMIKSLDDVPLTITSIRPIHPMFRGTSCFPIQPINTPTSQLSSSLDPINVVITFESSSKWPEDLAAISRIKCAFYIRIAQSMESKYHGNNNTKGHNITIQHKLKHHTTSNHVTYVRSVKSLHAYSVT